MPRDSEAGGVNFEETIGVSADVFSITSLSKNTILSVFFKMTRNFGLGYLCTFLFLVESVQYLSFALTVDIPWDDSWFRIIQAIFTVVRRLPAGFNEAAYVTLLSLSLAFVIILSLLFAYTVYNTLNGLPTPDMVMDVLHHAFLFMVPWFLTTTVSLCLAFFNCEYSQYAQNCSSPSHTLYLVLAMLSMLGMVPFSVLGSLLFYDTSPVSRNAFARNPCRLELAYLFCKLLHSFLAEVFPTATSWRAFVVLVTTGALYVYHMRNLPFYSFNVNCARASLFLMTIVASICSVIAALGARSSVLGIVFLVLAIPMSVLGSAGVWYRLRSLTARLPEEIVHGHELPYTRVCEVEMALRAKLYRNGELMEKALHAQRKRPEYNGHEELLFEWITEVYSQALDQFKRSTYIRLSYITFLLAFPGNYRLSILILKSIKPLRPYFDLNYVTFTRTNERKSIEELYHQGDTEEIARNLRYANRFTIKAKSAIQYFWGLLLRDHINLSLLPDVVAYVVKREKDAERVYKLLLQKYPRAPKVLRAYGRFLSEVKNSPMEAAVCFERANEIEEEYRGRPMYAALSVIGSPKVSPFTSPKNSPRLSHVPSYGPTPIAAPSSYLAPVPLPPLPGQPPQQQSVIYDSVVGSPPLSRGNSMNANDQIEDAVLQQAAERALRPVTATNPNAKLAKQSSAPALKPGVLDLVQRSPASPGTPGTPGTPQAGMTMNRSNNDLTASSPTDRLAPIGEGNVLTPGGRSRSGVGPRELSVIDEVLRTSQRRVSISQAGSPTGTPQLTPENSSGKLLPGDLVGNSRVNHTAPIMLRGNSGNTVAGDPTAPPSGQVTPTGAAPPVNISPGSGGLFAGETPPRADTAPQPLTQTPSGRFISRVRAQRRLPPSPLATSGSGEANNTTGNLDTSGLSETSPVKEPRDSRSEEGSRKGTESELSSMRLKDDKDSKDSKKSSKEKSSTKDKRKESVKSEKMEKSLEKSTDKGKEKDKDKEKDSPTETKKGLSALSRFGRRNSLTSTAEKKDDEKNNTLSTIGEATETSVSVKRNVSFNSSRLEEGAASAKRGGLRNMRPSPVPMISTSNESLTVPKVVFTDRDSASTSPASEMNRSPRKPIRGLNTITNLSTLHEHIEEDDEDAIHPATEDDTSSSHLERRTLSVRERERHMYYRRQVESTRSQGLRRLELAVRLILFVVVLVVCIVFIHFKSVNVNFSSSVTTMEHTAECCVASQQGWGSARGIDIVDAITNTTIIAPNLLTVLAKSNSDILAAAKLLEDDTQNLYLNRNASYTAIDDAWETATIQYPTYTHDGDAVTYSARNLWDSSQAFASACRRIASLPNNTDISTNVDLRAVLPVGGGPLLVSLRALVAAYRAVTQRSLVDAEIVLGVMYPLIILGLAFAAVFIFRPFFRNISSERLSTMQLFLAIPKPTVAAIFQRFTVAKPTASQQRRSRHTPSAVDDDDSDDMAVDEWDTHEKIGDTDVAGKSDRKARRYTMLYVAVFTMIALIMAITVVLLMLYYERLKQSNAEMDLIGRELYLTKRIFYLVVEGCVDNIPIAPPVWSAADLVALIQADIAEASSVHFALKFGNATYGTRGFNNRYGPLDDLFYQVQCYPQLDQQQCYSFDSLFAFYIDLASRLVDGDPGELAMSNANLNQLAALMPLVSTGVQSAVSIMATESLNFVDTIDFVTDLVFVIFLVIIFIVYAAVFYPMAKHLMEENQRTLTMLLMIPLEVVDSVPTIQRFLETGEQIDQKKAEELLEEAEETTKSILQAAADAVILINERGNIEVFNHAAEAMFLYRVDEILGQNVSLLMPEPDRSQHNGYIDKYLSSGEGTHIGTTQETLGMRSSGEIFPIQISLSKGTAHGKTFFAAIIRDITERKLRQDELDAERLRSEALLLNVLPHPVAETLKLRGGPIAEQFDNVTILFSDIVQFTTLSSSIPASAVVDMLNFIFSLFDTLAERYGLEKIKTIGDAYMVGGGLPERIADHAPRVADFALDMLDAVRDYNTKFQPEIQIRVGIHSGPVVAGVIGVKKFCYDLWGDTVNVASRMESTGTPMRIQISSVTRDLIARTHALEARGEIQVKGKGKMTTYFLNGRLDNQMELSATQGSGEHNSLGASHPSLAFNPPPTLSAAALLTPEELMMDEEDTEGTVLSPVSPNTPQVGVFSSPQHTQPPTPGSTYAKPTTPNSALPQLNPLPQLGTDEPDPLFLSRGNNLKLALGLRSPADARTPGTGPSNSSTPTNPRAADDVRSVRSFKDDDATSQRNVSPRGGIADFLNGTWTRAPMDMATVVQLKSAGGDLLAATQPAISPQHLEGHARSHKSPLDWVRSGENTPTRSELGSPNTGTPGARRPASNDWLKQSGSTDRAPMANGASSLDRSHPSMSHSGDAALPVPAEMGSMRARRRSLDPEPFSSTRPESRASKLWSDPSLESTDPTGQTVRKNNSASFTVTPPTPIAYPYGAIPTTSAFHPTRKDQNRSVPHTFASPALANTEMPHHQSQPDIPTEPPLLNTHPKHALRNEFMTPPSPASPAKPQFNGVRTGAGLDTASPASNRGRRPPIAPSSGGTATPVTDASSSGDDDGLNRNYSPKIPRDNGVNGNGNVSGNVNGSVNGSVSGSGSGVGAGHHHAGASVSGEAKMRKRIASKKKTGAKKKGSTKKIESSSQI